MREYNERHTSTSGYEIGPDGTKVTKVVKDNYNIITNDDYCHIQGTSRATIDKGLRVTELIVKVNLAIIPLI